MRYERLEDWLKWQETLHPQAIDLGLDRVRAVVDRMGLARPKFPIVTVGGTNGKGSTVAMLESILRSSGYRVGAYTSPHIQSYNERIRINGAEVSDVALCDAFARIDRVRGDISLTYFEFGTIAAMDSFVTENVEIAILEVGMGGRLDAVNVWDADVAIVTGVALDHMEWLGSDRETIAFEKAGIFRAGRPAIFGQRDAPARLVQYADGIGARLFRQGFDYSWSARDGGWDWVGPEGSRFSLPPPSLRGTHQFENASTVLMTLQAIRHLAPVSVGAVRDGLLGVKLRGRFEVLPAAITCILDVAHNPQGAETLAATLAQYRCTGRTLAVIGMLKDKDIAGTCRPLVGLVDHWYLGPVDSPRAASSAELGDGVGTHVSSDKRSLFDAFEQAYSQAQRDARAGDRIVVFGSFYAVSGAL